MTADTHTELRAGILAAIGPMGARTVAEIAQDLGRNPREVQDALHQMDDAGDVLMKNGLYRRSALSLRFTEHDDMPGNAAEAAE